MIDTHSMNPYQSPGMASPIPVGRRRLAHRLTRFLAAMVDNVLGFMAIIPGFILFVIGLVQNGNDPQSEAGMLILFGGIGIIVMGLLVYAAVQVYLLAVSSQSIGKYLLRIQILDIHTQERSSFVNCFLLRSVVGNFILGQVPLYGLVDVLFIFRDDQRCIHDLIASSVVVDLE